MTFIQHKETGKKYSLYIKTEISQCLCTNPSILCIDTRCLYIARKVNELTIEKQMMGRKKYVYNRPIHSYSSCCPGFRSAHLGRKTECEKYARF